jgi:hypothetical protein
MHRLMSKAALVAGLAALPAAVLAQGAPRHEFGVDLGMAFESVSSLGGAGSTTLFASSTPVDVRVGWVSPTPLSLEGRLTFNFNSRGFGSNASYVLAPDLNVLYRLGGGAGTRRPLTGPYLTGGLGLMLANAPNGAGGTSSGLIPSLNGGIGTRMAAGTGAWRLEGYVAYAFQDTKLRSPAIFSVGARVGLSLWH